jgi:hypothetical protein
MNYSELSYKLTKDITKSDKKQNGIYFTPPKTINDNLSFLRPYMADITSVLEPSCGSCEYIQALTTKFTDLNITGIEYNKPIYDAIKHLSNDNIKLYNSDFITYNTTVKYDLIIGNPPYYVMKKNDVDLIYHDYFDGRPNIFILFIIKSLTLLNDNGILSFVLPKNFLNCLYYAKTRKFIDANYKILTIMECHDNYIETQQNTIILIIQKTMGDNGPYMLTNGAFGTQENIIKLRQLYENSQSLSQLHFTVKVGNVVWNQHKEILTDDATKTLLIYSGCIKNNELQITPFTNKDKKNYINKTGVTGPMLVVNRGYGVGKYHFDYCLIEGGFEYLVENHLICIVYTETIENDELIALYKKIIKSLENAKTQQFIELYFGNNAINTTELCEMLPIYSI